ncbi:MAG: Ig-like domain-containing protein [Synergistaceae bacterium]|nr:Ig-like domain-containing protein [Synergistaceae bacterium]
MKLEHRRNTRWLVFLLVALAVLSCVSVRILDAASPIFTIPDVNAVSETDLAKVNLMRGQASVNAVDDTPFEITINYSGTITEAFSRDMTVVFDNWARGIREMSNGAHTLATYRVFGNTNNSMADVYWDANTDATSIEDAQKKGIWPHIQSRSLGGYRDGASTGIFFSDWFTYAIINNAYNVSRPEYAGDFNRALRAIGYVLAHESGHYIYGQYDEYPGKEDSFLAPSYSPRKGDMVALPSIMDGMKDRLATRPGDGSNDDMRFLNFSTAAHYPSDLYTTGQFRGNGKSSWEHLSNDQREKFPKLASVIPNGSYSLTTQGESIPPRTMSYSAKLTSASRGASWTPPKIYWYDRSGTSVSNRHRVIYLLDNSGSMSGTPINEAKKLLAAQVGSHKVGDVVGIYTFDTAVKKVVPYIAITSDTASATEGHRSGMIAKIKGIQSGGGTAIYNSLYLVLEEFEADGAPGYIQLITDGENGSSGKTVDDVIALAKRIGIEVRVTKTGDSVQPDLIRIANGTRLTGSGNGVSAPTRTLDLLEAQYANAIAQSDAMLMTSATQRVEQSAQEAVEFFVDSGVSYLSVQALNPSGDINVDFTVQAPDGTIHQMLDLAGDSAQWMFEIQSPGAGKWVLTAANKATAPVNVSTFIVGYPESAKPGMAVGIGITGFGSVRAGENQTLTAHTSGNNYYDLTGVKIDGVLKTPAEEEIAVAFFDDGTNGDKVAGDGVYTATVAGTNFVTNGQYKATVFASNPDGTAIETSIGVLYTMPPDDGSWSPPVMGNITENFQRQGFMYFNVEGGTNLVRASSVRLDKSSLQMKPGDQETLTATVSPETTTNKRVDWFSSDSSVAIVDENGEVYAVAAGIASITAITADGNRQANCNVTVAETAEATPPETPEPVYPINGATVEEGNFTLRASPFTASDGSVSTGSRWQIQVGSQVEFDETLTVSGNTFLVNANISQFDDVTVDTSTGKKILTAQWRIKYFYKDKNGVEAETDWSDWGQFKIESSVNADDNNNVSGDGACSSGLGALFLGLFGLALLKKRYR